MAVLSLSAPADLSETLLALRRLQLEHPEILKIVLVDACDRDLAISAFRSGARGIFAINEASPPSPFENPAPALYNHRQRNALPDATSKPSLTPPPRRWTIFAAALLLFALALVVIYTSHRAFSSPLALVVVAAIAMAALLLQLRLRKNQNKDNDNGIDARPSVRSPLWLNVLGVAFALAALAADILHWTANAMLVSALGAVVCFALSATAVLHSLRKK